MNAIHLSQQTTVYTKKLGVIFSASASFACRIWKSIFSLVSLGLPGRQKEILYLKYVKGLSFEEIAQTIGVTLKASYNYIQELFNPLGIILATQVTQLHSSFAFILRKHNIEMDYLTNWVNKKYGVQLCSL